MAINKELFGKTPDGTEIDLYTLTAGGFKAKLTNFGGILVSLDVPDKNGKADDVTLGYDTLDEYISDPSCFGASIGRYANRIALGKFTLEGKAYALETNHGRHHLHSGSRGLRKSIFHAEQLEDAGGPGIRFSYLSPAGEYGYPGNLQVSFLYSLNSSGALRIEISATTDAPTPVNLTHHSYFNLKGAGNGNILDHELMLCAEKYTHTDTELIPTGKLPPVKGTHLDFTTARPIGSQINGAPESYDHNFVLNDPDGFALGARLRDPQSGRTMEVWTTQPGLQVYTANHLSDTPGKGGKIYRQHGGVSLEPQHFPDSVNHPEFPNTILRPGEKFHQETEFRFV